MKKPPYRHILANTGYKFKNTADCVECKFIFQDKQVAIAFMKSICKKIYLETGCNPRIWAEYVCNGGLIRLSNKYNIKLSSDSQTPHQAPHDLNDYSSQRKAKAPTKGKRKTPK